jgi:hypothetical protein
MDRRNNEPRESRRDFFNTVGGAGAAAAFGALGLPRPVAAQPDTLAVEWDVSWIDRVRNATHRAVFDAPNPGIVVDLAARYLDNLRTVYGDRAGNVCAVLNIRTRAIPLALSDAIWAKYPIGEDYKVNDPATNAPARRNVDLRRSASTHALATTVEEIQSRGAIILVCDFAMGHLANRLSEKAGTTSAAVHSDLRMGLVSGAILVPSGIFGAAEAQTAGCAFIPA